jgi:hypothetical protein
LNNYRIINKKYEQGLTSLIEINAFITELYSFILFGDRNVMEKDFLQFIAKTETSYNLVNNNFMYQYNFVYKLEILTMIYLNSSSTDIVDNIITKLTDTDRINNFIILNAFELFVNIINYNELLTTLSNALPKLIYNLENSNYGDVIAEVWETYFSNTIFIIETYEPITDTFKYDEIIISISQLEYFYTEYIKYEATRTNIDDVYNIFYILQSITTPSNVQTIYTITNNNCWSLSKINYTDVNDNVPLLNIQLKMLNYYFMKMGNMDITDEYIASMFYKLQILWKIKVFVVLSLDIKTYFNIIDRSLAFCNQIIYDGYYTDCINLCNEIVLTNDYSSNTNYGNYENNIFNYYKNNYDIVIREFNRYGLNTMETCGDNLKLLEDVLMRLETQTISEINIREQYFIQIINSIFLINNANELSAKIISNINEYINIFKLTYNGTIFIDIVKEDVVIDIIQYFYNICLTLYIQNLSQNEYIDYSIINKVIIELASKSDSKLIYSLLVGYNNDEELTNKINIIFNELSNNIVNNTTLIEKQILQFTIKTYNGTGSTYLKNISIRQPGTDTLVEIWKNMLVLIVNVSTSSMIKSLKSIIPETYNIQKEYVNYLMKYTNGIINDKGLLNMIDKIELYFGNQLVDTITSEMYMIYKTLFQNDSSIIALNQFYGLGDGGEVGVGGAGGTGIEGEGDGEWVYGLRNYIIQFKNKELYLPNYFYFKEYMSSIPLISCMYTDVSMRLYLQRESIIKSFYSPTLLGPGIGQFNDVSMLLDYVYVEKDERARLSRGTIDNLITTHKNYTSCKPIVVNTVQNGDRLIRIRHDFTLDNLVKEIFWTNKFSVTTAPAPSTASTSTTSTASTNNLHDITDKIKILSTLIYVNGARRDGIDPVNQETINPTFQESINPDYNTITTTINQYKYNTSAYGPKDIRGRGYNAYSFAFKPEDFQPSGAINMSQINTFSIELVIDPATIVVPMTTLSTLSMYTTGYNFMRYQGGIGALLYTL